jgi:uncharacterized protein YdaU (DUF1376 family)
MSNALPWFALDAQDWLNGTKRLSAASQGVYMRLLTVMWLRKARLPNDISELAAETDINPKQMRKCLAELISKGKITDDGETIGNPRMDRDIEAILARSTTAKKREAAKRAGKTTVDQSSINPRSIANVSTINRECIDDKSSIIDTESVKNQGLKKQTETTETIYIERERERNKEENSQLATPRSVAASERAEELEGLNGATTEIVRGLARWLNPMMPDQDTAKRVLARDVAIYGPQAVKDGYADLATAVDANDPISNPLKAFNGFVKRAAERQKAKADKPGKPVRTAEQTQTARFELWCKTFRDFREWKTDLGPPPGAPGCRVPPDILSKFNLPIGA